MHWSHHHDQLREVIAQPRFGIISDFDGTLSHYIGNPSVSAIKPENAKLLDELAERVTLIALVSGRAVADLRGKFERPHVVYYGSHGMEYWRGGDAHIVEAARAWSDPLARLLDSLTAEIRPLALEGVYIENKHVTASVHYRRATDPDYARAVLYDAIAPLCDQYGFHLFTGQFIWEIKPPLDIHKGSAVRAIVDEYQLDGVLFMGDDVTDFAGMDALRDLAASRSLIALSVGVVHPTTPAALLDHCDVTANGIDDTTELLRWLRNQYP